ncbi:MAG: alanine--tRNA ligase [Gammaproteobacteria bacterium]|nr:alanine--tRNA ligase [Gammaproteobacteria bacterium]
MKSAELRQAFLDFFQSRGHEVVASSPLVPANDPTLLFTNAGMVQFKDVFLGREQRSYQRAVSSQRCVRAGGKHNDLENVGYTARHHTFFEMLGNFSFGDYFKDEAIGYAWEFVTGVLGLPAERLWVTVYEEDEEAAEIWLKKIGVDPKRFSRLGAKDNFWAMGDTGPCGPCSEIFYDHGDGIPGGPPGSPDEDGDRYVEIWNLVFMQFDRSDNGVLAPLPKPSVDTGMGLERTAAVMQGVHSNYSIDLFRHLIDAVMSTTGCADRENNSLKVIADHIRACAFLVVDGVLPSNEGRGYVLRRIMRRALRHGYMLGVQDAFFYKLVKPLQEQMGDAYPELGKQRAHIEKILLQEERRFAETLGQGMSILEDAVGSMKGKEIPGDVVFKLYDTYGFPVDLTADIARERGLAIDEAGFEVHMNQQRRRARAASRFEADGADQIEVDASTDFRGYDGVHGSGEIVELIVDGKFVDSMGADDAGIVVLDTTTFYAEGGGQVGDAGELRVDGAVFTVEDTRKFKNAYGHIGKLQNGVLQKGQRVETLVDAPRRAATVLNHSATHLLHAALRKVLGTHVQQKGSLVAPDRLRFDFSHYEPLTDSQLDDIERMVNGEIRSNVAAEIRMLPYDKAIESGALALFGEKYGDEVRVLSLGDFSTELCGGTHVSRTGDIGLFKIIGETGVAAGVRRIEALTGEGALAWVKAGEASLNSLASLVKGGRDELAPKIKQLLERNRELEKDLGKAQARLAGNRGDELADKAVDVAGIKVLAATLEGADPKVLRETVDRLKAKLGSSVVVLSSIADGKVRLVAGVSKDKTGQIKAGDIIGEVAAMVGGRGGGRADMAQAGGTDPGSLPAALAAVAGLVRERVS